MLTVHHLDYSRSTRVLWLLEELGLPYELVRYRRPVGGAAPAALAAVHPLARSPVLVDDGFVLSESSAILRYIDARHGGSRFTPNDPHLRARHDEWLDFVESTLAPPLFVPLVAGGDLPARLREVFAGQLGKALKHVERALADRDFLMGDALTLADIQIAYVLVVCASTGACDGSSTLSTYRQRLLARPALQRAIEAGGPMA